MPQQRFWSVCLLVRLYVAVLATLLTTCLHRHASAQYAVSIYATVTLMGFFWSFLSQACGVKTRGLFGGTIWWTHARYVHMLAWFSLAVASWLRLYASGAILFVDVVVGVIAGILQETYEIHV